MIKLLVPPRLARAGKITNLFIHLKFKIINLILAYYYYSIRNLMGQITAKRFAKISQIVLNNHIDRRHSVW